MKTYTVDIETEDGQFLETVGPFNSKDMISLRNELDNMQLLDGASMFYNEPVAFGQFREVKANA